MNNEAHLSTEQNPPQENPRFPRPHENCRRTKSHSTPKTPGKKIARGLTFPKRLKLRERVEYQKILKIGQRLVGRLICLDWKKVSASETRLGITVSRRYGAAHERNRFKRIVREAFRTSYPLLPLSVDLHVVPRQRSKEATSSSMRIELLDLIKKIP
jgi:ribonuclease P protein component